MGERRIKMSQTLFKEKPVKVHCLNCHNEVIGFRDDTGITKIQCPRCGSVSVSKVMGRRHVRVDIFAPKGQELIN